MEDRRFLGGLLGNDNLLWFIILFLLLFCGWGGLGCGCGSYLDPK